MANQRRTLTAQQSPSTPPARRPRWLAPGPLLIAAGAAVLLGLAYADGGEEALRPIAEPVDLPEQPQ